MKNRDLLIGKILDFLMTVEIKRSNLFKATFRAFENIFINGSFLFRLRSSFRNRYDEKTDTVSPEK